MIAWLRTIVEDPRTERVIMSLIIVNAVILGLETSKSAMAAFGRLLEILDHVILAVFVIEIAARVAWSGVGRRLKSETPTAAAVGDAVRSVLRSPTYRANAERIAASMAAAGGMPQLVRLVDEVAATPFSAH